MPRAARLTPSSWRRIVRFILLTTIHLGRAFVREALHYAAHTLAHESRRSESAPIGFARPLIICFVPAVASYATFSTRTPLDNPAPKSAGSILRVAQDGDGR